jgi:hypothetical protein
MALGFQGQHSTAIVYNRLYMHCVRVLMRNIGIGPNTAKMKHNFALHDLSMQI